ncbi:MAG TPA: PD-(D/E)XK nuclease family protein [Acidimicrobiales bacterium]|nr:PD-(D/E)XK nuclease family protein [Acidimicrobiales bacterium]
MALVPPTGLSPSRVSSFQDCALAFRFSAIDHLPEPSSLPAVRGTLVHAALERLFVLEPEERTPERAVTCLAEAHAELLSDPEYLGLGLDEEHDELLRLRARDLLDNYFRLEDPRQIRPIGIELRLEAPLGDLNLRGIIDRLELDEDGGLVVTDYKTGAAPRQQYEQGRLGGVHFYSFLCEELFGVRPSRVQLLYLADPVAIVAEPTDQASRGLRRKLTAVWSAIERSCEREDFRPRPSKLCDWCAFQIHCPAFGGDPEAARREAAAVAAVEATPIDLQPVALAG